jgi:hypothetical protein
LSGVCGACHSLACGGWDAMPAKFWINVRFTLDFECANQLVNDLVDSFHLGICLWISSGKQLSDTMLVLEHSFEFGCELASSVHDCFRAIGDA